MPTKKSEAITIYADGAISPERGGAGIVVCNEHGQVILLANRQFRPLTSTEAEYAGLLMALEVAASLHSRTTEIRLDSEVVVNQMTGRYAVRSKTLKDWHIQACERSRLVRDVSFKHVPRTQNAVAHALASEATAGRKWCTQGAPCSG